LRGYDANHVPPEHLKGARGIFMQRLALDELCELVEDQLRGHLRRNDVGLGARAVLEMLSRYPGDTWEERWLASGCDAAPNTWVTHHGLPTAPFWSSALAAMNPLLQLRVLRPSYSWLLNTYRVINLRAFLEVNAGSDLQRLRSMPAYANNVPRYQVDSERALARVMIRTGKQIDQLNGDDLLQYADVVKTSGRQRREHLLWELLVELGPLADEAPTLRATWSARGNSRQHSTATLVDRYGIPPSGVRDLLVNYLNEVRVSMDYSSLEGLAYRLARLFWFEVLQINPAQSSLGLSPSVAAAWLERLSRTTDGQPRRETHSTLFAVRGLYRDLAEWSHDDPARWGVWVAPCPVPRHVSRAAAKQKLRQRATMQERTRMLTPLLPRLMSTVQAQKGIAEQFLRLAQDAEHEQRFDVDGCAFVRIAPEEKYAYATRARVWARLVDAENRPPWIRGQADRIDVTAQEEDGFWAWAIVETLRHTGIRVEELLELTQLSLRHYTAPTTGTLVPLLHIVPSKNDCERLIPMTPELVQVLLAVLRRAKAGNDSVPLSVRYDPHEKVHGDPFPHLFSRRVGIRQEVLSGHYLRGVLIHVSQAAGLTDAGQPVHFTPHDFRRLFATDAVNNGLPLHIAAALLGHLNLDTTRGYTAVFPEHLIAAHQAFIERRRKLRPAGEDHPADPDEWANFEEHFLLRRVALGECHRPYGTPCVHEHACTRCRFLRVDPAQLGRIEDMTCNAEDRLNEARDRGWLGEVAALEESLTHLRARSAEARLRLADNGNPFAAEGTMN
jgi:integrase